MRNNLINEIISDIKYLEDLGEEIEWDSVDVNNYSLTPTNQEIKEAFKRCGYSVK